VADFKKTLGNVVRHVDEAAVHTVQAGLDASVYLRCHVFPIGDHGLALGPEGCAKGESESSSCRSQNKRAD
jgi:hypothetical protein